MEVENSSVDSIYTIKPKPARMWNVLSHVIHYRRVSTTVAIIIRAIYKFTRSPHKLLKCIN